MKPRKPKPTLRSAMILAIPASRVRKGMQLRHEGRLHTVEDVAPVFYGRGRGMQGRDLFLSEGACLRVHHAAHVSLYWHPPMRLP